MGIVQSLSLIALRQVATGASRAAGLVGAEAVAGFLSDHFTNNSQRLRLALQDSTGRAWHALEIALAGESLWQKLDNADDRAFRTQVRVFLDAAPLPELREQGEEFRRECLRELRAARKSGLLLSGAAEPKDLARQAAQLADQADCASLVDREWQALDQTADLLREARHHNLARLVALRPGAGQTPLLAVAVRFYFRRAVETDAELHRGLSFAQWQAIAESQQQGFAQLGQALDTQGQRLTELLDLMGEVHGAVLDLRREIAGQREQIQQLAHDVLNVLGQHQLERRELRVGDSLSIRTDEERRLVKNLVARYRELPPDQRKRMPALLNAVGKMEVVAGNFDAARRDFEELVQFIPAEKDRAEVHFNAYQAALESRHWEAALIALRDAIALDPERFTPFPQSKYEPQRILGAGGFGVAFLCRDRHTGSKVVVKALRADGLDRSVTEVFAEARTLEELEHENIIRLRHCDYAGAGNSRPYLVMDYFESVNLADHIAENGPLPAAEATALLAGVARALHRAHEKGICHRDVKPGNLLIRRGETGWQIKLIDFGLALHQQTVKNTIGAASSYTQTLIGSSIAGTLDYAAPEQLGKRPGEKVGPHSDVYGLGKTACFALFGTTLPLARHWRGVSPELADLLGQCLADDPKERPASCKEVAERLAGSKVEAAPVAIPVARAVPPPEEAPRLLQPEQPLDPRPHLIIGGLLGLVAGLIAGVQEIWFPWPGASWLVMLMTAAVVGLAAMAGRRRHPLSPDRPVAGLRRLSLADSAVVVLLGMGLLEGGHFWRVYGGVAAQLLASACFLVLAWGLGYVWGRLFGQTLSAMIAFGLIVFVGIQSQTPNFMFIGLFMAAICAVAFEMALPLRNADRSVDRFIGSLLLPFCPVFAGRKKPESAVSSARTAVESTPATQATSSPILLAIRLPLILIGFAALGLAMGLSAGATGLDVVMSQRKDQTYAMYNLQNALMAWLCGGGAGAAVAIMLSRRLRIRTTPLWFLASVAICVGLAALGVLIGWQWIQSKIAVFVCLLVWGAAVGALAGASRERPQLGTILGTVFAGVLVLAGAWLGHPDPAGLLGLSVGVLAGTLLWSGLPTSRLRLARGLALIPIALVLAAVLFWRSELGGPVRYATIRPDYPYYHESKGADSSREGGFQPPVFSEDGGQLLLRLPRSVVVWDVKAEKVRDRLDIDANSRLLALGFHQGEPLCLLSTQKFDNQRGGYLTEASIFRIASGSVIGSPKQVAGTVSVAASNNGTFVVASLGKSKTGPGAGEDVIELTYLSADGSAPWTSQLNKKTSPTALALEGELLLLGFEDGTVGLAHRQGQTTTLAEETRKLTTPIRAIGFTSGKRLGWALAGPRGYVDYMPRRGQAEGFLVWKIAGWKDFSNLELPRQDVTCAAVGPEGRLLLGKLNGKAELWDLERQERIRTFKLGNSFFLHTAASLSRVAFSPVNYDEAYALDGDGRLAQWSLSGSVFGGGEVRTGKKVDSPSPGPRSPQPKDSWEKK